MSRAINATATDGTIDAHIFTPDDTATSLPPVILFTDIGGLRTCYFEKAQKVADGGYAVLMPNVYYRDAAGQIVPDGKSFRDSDIRPTLLEYASHLTPDVLGGDFDALLAAIETEAEFTAGPIGVVGYCMTGAFALRMAARYPDRVAAAAGFHSARLAIEDDANSPLHIVDAIHARVYLGHADGDALMPPADIARLDAALAAASVHFTTELYRGATHGYTARDAPVYDAAADALHYKRLFALLEETVR